MVPRLDDGGAGDVDHAVAHEEPVQEHGRGRERDLGQFEHDAHLHDEIHPFGAVFPLFGGGETGEDGGRELEFGL